jgi:hypothetical protein
MAERYNPDNMPQVTMHASVTLKQEKIVLRDIRAPRYLIFTVAHIGHAFKKKLL